MRFFLMLALVFTLMMPAGHAENEAVIPTWDNVRPLGRTHPLKTALWLVQSGSGAEFTFCGTRCEVTILGNVNASLSSDADSHTRIAIEVNGVRVLDDMIDAREKTYPVFESDTAQDVTVRIIKLSEAAQSTCGIGSITVEAEDGIHPTAGKARRIEFIGDSITCGYGVDDEDRNHHFSTRTEDATKTYAYRTAQLLDADWSLVSYSGHGVVSGYTAIPGVAAPHQRLPMFYGKLGFSAGAFQKKIAASVKWDFSAFVPDIIVINLGTNDDSYVKGDAGRTAEFREGYTVFLRDVHGNNPDAMILCTLGIMGDALYPAVKDAVAAYTAETGDTRVATMRFDVQRAADGYAADWHPTERTHIRAAEKLAAEIRSLMGWE